MLDFSVLSRYTQPVAIHCPEEHQADELMEAMRKQHPELVSVWRPDSTHWSWYREKTCYAPHIYDDRAKNMQFSPVGYWEPHGYIVVPFDELMHAHDLGEFEAGNQSELLEVFEIGV